jgi:hypothetical protein
MGKDAVQDRAACAAAGHRTVSAVLARFPGNFRGYDQEEV